MLLGDTNLDKITIRQDPSGKQYRLHSRHGGQKLCGTYKDGILRVTKMRPSHRCHKYKGYGLNYGLATKYLAPEDIVVMETRKGVITFTVKDLLEKGNIDTLGQEEKQIFYTI